MKQLFPFLRYLKPHKRLFFLTLLCGLIYGVCSGFGIPAIFEWVFKKVFEAEGKPYTLGQIVQIALLVPFLFSVRGLFGFLNTYYMGYCGLLIASNIKQALFEKLQELPLAFFDRHKQGDLFHRVSADTHAIQSVLLELASELFKQPIQIVSAIGGLGYLSFKHHNSIFLLIFLGITPLCLLPTRLIKKKLRCRSRQAQDAAGRVAHCLNESLQALIEIRSYTLEQKEQARLEGHLQHYNTFELKLLRYLKLQQPIMEFIGSVLIAFVFIYAYFRGIPFSVFSAMGLGLYFALDPLKKLSNLLGNVHRTYGAIERVNEILNLPCPIQSPLEPLPLGKVKGDINFSNVSFSYQEKTVLQDISVHVPAYSTCALVGHSGAGKTTFLKLLPRFYDVSSGSICIDGKDIRSLSLTALRQAISVVSQHPVLFHDTIYNNILLAATGVGKDAVYQAAHNAFAHEFILELGGYDTIVGDRGDRLSGGQKQRIALARAFLKNAPILVLDEATSALDSESEHYIKEALERLRINKTVLIIAHRLSTIQKADKILVFNHGAVIAEGTHESLLRTQPLYENWVRLQNL